MNALETVHQQLHRLVEILESYVLDESGDLDEIRMSLHALEEEVRFFQADEISDALAEVDRLLGVSEGTAVDADAVLPVVFRLRDLLASAQASGDNVDQPFLEFDLRSEIDEVLRIDRAEARIVNGRLALGNRLYLIVVRVRPGFLDAAEEHLEHGLNLLRVRRQDRSSRIAALAVEPADPRVDALLGERLWIDRDAPNPVVNVLVREVARDELEGAQSIADDWYAQVPPISVAASPSALERVWVLMEGISPSPDDRGASALWQEMRQVLSRTLTIRLRDMLGDMRDALESMAIDAGRQVEFEFVASVGSIGSDVAEFLRRALFELLANAIQHGIESPDERELAGKQPVGRVLCTVARDPGGLTIRIEDDGRGMASADARRRRSGGIQRARRIIAERLGGVLRMRRAPIGTTATIQLPALQGVYRALVAERAGRAISIPAALVEWAGTVGNERLVRDPTGARFLRYERSLVPLVEPVVRPDPDDSDDSSDMVGSGDLVGERSTDGGGAGRPTRAVAVVRIAGNASAVALDRVTGERTVAGDEGGRVRLGRSGSDWAYPVVLQELIPRGT